MSPWYPFSFIISLGLCFEISLSVFYNSVWEWQVWKYLLKNGEESVTNLGPKGQETNETKKQSKLHVSRGPEYTCLVSFITHLILSHCFSTTPSQGHMATSGNIRDCHDGGRGSAPLAPHGMLPSILQGAGESAPPRIIQSRSWAALRLISLSVLHSHIHVLWLAKAAFGTTVWNRTPSRANTHIHCWCL